MKALCALAVVVAIGCSANERKTAPAIAPTSLFASTPVGVAFAYPPLTSHSRHARR
jgi:hypothetical protein